MVETPTKSAGKTKKQADVHVLYWIWFAAISQYKDRALSIICGNIVEDSQTFDTTNWVDKITAAAAAADKINPLKDNSGE